MIEFFKSILNAVGTLLDLVKYLVTGLVQLFAMIPSAFSMLTYSIGFLPTVLLLLSLLLSLSFILLLVVRW